jgi:hypothetical protein
MKILPKHSYGRILGDFAMKGTIRGWTSRSKVEKFADLRFADQHMQGNCGICDVEWAQRIYAWQNKK